MNEEPIYHHQDLEGISASKLPARSSIRIWSYILTVSVTVLITFALTIGLAFAVIGSANIAQLFRNSTTQDTLSMLDTTDPATKAAVDKLRKIYSMVDNNFVKDLTDAELIDAMARGLLSELKNPYTFYLSAEQNKQIADSLSGNYSGIGAMVAMNKDGMVQITELSAGSPAIAAGVKIGDVFLSVNGTDVTKISDVGTLAALVRGTEGSFVEIVFYRLSTKQEIKLSIERKRIISSFIASRMIEEGIGYIQIREFSNGVSGQFRDAVVKLEQQGARHLIIDLRSNGGGLATEVLNMLDFMLPEVEMTRFVGRQNGEPFTEIKKSDKAMGVPTDMRYAILTNGMTASASELMAGCLHDHDLAYLIGEQTFGKGSGTITIALDDGSAFNLTNFLYYLPDGESIEGKGLTPDEKISLPEAVKDQSLALLDPASDTQLTAGIAYLRGLLGKTKGS
jgi:carboxyl-terminal processing protease